jgi:hypothetical protein
METKYFFNTDLYFGEFSKKDYKRLSKKNGYRDTYIENFFNKKGGATLVAGVPSLAGTLIPAASAVAQYIPPGLSKYLPDAISRRLNKGESRVEILGDGSTLDITKLYKLPVEELVDSYDYLPRDLQMKVDILKPEFNKLGNIDGKTHSQLVEEQLTVDAGRAFLGGKNDLSINEVSSIFAEFESLGGVIHVTPQPVFFKKGAEELGWRARRHYFERGRVHLDSDDIIYPVCKGGINRSQMIHHLFKNKGMTVANPHGTIYGYDGTAWDYNKANSRMIGIEKNTTGREITNNEIDMSSRNVQFKDAFPGGRQSRFGLDKFTEAKSAEDFSEAMRVEFIKMMTESKSKIISFGSSGVHMAKKLFDLAKEINVKINAKIIIIPMEDSVHHSDCVNCKGVYMGMIRKVANLFTIDGQQIQVGGRKQRKSKRSRKVKSRKLKRKNN